MEDKTIKSDQFRGDKAGRPDPLEVKKDTQKRSRYASNDAKSMIVAFDKQAQREAIRVLVERIVALEARADEQDGLPPLETEQEQMDREKKEKEEREKKNPPFSRPASM